MTFRTPFGSNLSGFAKTASGEAVPVERSPICCCNEGALDFGRGYQGFAFGGFLTAGLLNKVAVYRNSEALGFVRYRAANNKDLKS
jgi:hypothetical protein